MQLSQLEKVAGTEARESLRQNVMDAILNDWSLNCCAVQGSHTGSVRVLWKTNGVRRLFTLVSGPG